MSSAVLEELLFSMSGFTQVDLFTNDAGSLLEPAERELASRLLKLGECVRVLEAFSSASTSPSGAPRSPFQSALSVGLSEVSALYKSAIVEAQAKATDGPLPLSALQHYFADFALVLPALAQLCRAIEKGGLRGRALVAHLQALASSGPPALKVVCQRLLFHCVQAFYRRLTAWVCHGVLLEPTPDESDFFIADLGPVAPPSASAQETSTAEWLRRFEAKADAAPAEFSARPEVLEATLFIGRSVRLLLNQATATHRPLSSADTLRYEEMCNTLREARDFDSALLIRVLRGIKADVGERLWRLLKHTSGLVEEMDLLRDFLLMRRGDLIQVFLADARTVMRQPLMKGREPGALSDLRHHWRQLQLREKDASAERLTVSLGPTADELAARQRTHQGASSSSSPAPVALFVPSLDSWDGLCLEYSPPWPLGLLFTSDRMEVLRAAFRLLLLLTRCQVRLDDAFGLLRRHKAQARRPHGNPAASASSIAPLLDQIWMLRSHVGSVLSHVQAYLQVDVLEEAFDRVARDLGAAGEFDQAEAALDRFTATLRSQFLLDSSMASDKIGQVLRVSMKLAAFIEAVFAVQPGQVVRHPGVDDVANALQGQCHQALRSLYLSFTGNPGVWERAPSLSHLMLRLDFTQTYRRAILSGAVGGGGS